MTSIASPSMNSPPTHWGASARTTSSSSTSAYGHSDETPRYPHSVELRTLAQTGVLGALLALVGLGAASWRPPRVR